jgi:hypothetical protein
LRFKRISLAAAALAVIMALGAPISAAAAPPSGQQGSAASSAAGNLPHQGRHIHRCGGDFGALKTLSGITGISVDDILNKYPQKTSWQIAKQLGKLDALKKGFLTNQKTFIDKLVSEGKITAADGTKVYADLQKRVAAIDGTSIVTLGRPGFKPGFKSGKS